MEIERDPLVGRVIGSAIEVHRELGPGLLEGVYESCMAHEFKLAGLSHARQVSLPVVYKDHKADCGYRLDFLVEGRLIVELKSVEAIVPIHVAQMLTYLKLANVRQGLIVNFNVPLLKNGLKSVLRRVQTGS